MWELSHVIVLNSLSAHHVMEDKFFIPRDNPLEE